jgi:hypothetical protein
MGLVFVTVLVQAHVAMASIHSRRASRRNYYNPLRSAERSLSPTPKKECPKIKLNTSLAALYGAAACTPARSPEAVRDRYSSPGNIRFFYYKQAC